MQAKKFITAMVVSATVLAMSAVLANAEDPADPNNVSEGSVSTTSDTSSPTDVPDVGILVFSDTRTIGEVSPDEETAETTPGIMPISQPLLIAPNPGASEADADAPNGYVGAGNGAAIAEGSVDESVVADAAKTNVDTGVADVAVVIGITAGAVAVVALTRKKQSK